MHLTCWFVSRTDDTQPWNPGRAQVHWRVVWLSARLRLLRLHYVDCLSCHQCRLSTSCARFLMNWYFIWRTHKYNFLFLLSWTISPLTLLEHVSQILINCSQIGLFMLTLFNSLCAVDPVTCLRLQWWSYCTDEVNKQIAYFFGASPSKLRFVWQCVY